jgi:hypothetical protein
LPAGLPTVVLLVPTTRRIATTFTIRETTAEGLITNGDMGTTTKVVEANVPKGMTAVFGYDVEYYTKLKAHYAACSKLRDECDGLTGKELKAKKAELVQKIDDFRANAANQPSGQRALTNAYQRLAATAPQGTTGLVGAGEVSGDNIFDWHRDLDDWRKWARVGGATGAVTP